MGIQRECGVYVTTQYVSSLNVTEHTLTRIPYVGAARERGSRILIRRGLLLRRILIRRRHRQARADKRRTPRSDKSQERRRDQAQRSKSSSARRPAFFVGGRRGGLRRRTRKPEPHREVALPSIRRSHRRRRPCYLQDLEVHPTEPALAP